MEGDAGNEDCVQSSAFGSVLLFDSVILCDLCLEGGLRSMIVPPRLVSCKPPLCTGPVQSLGSWTSLWLSRVVQ